MLLLPGLKVEPNLRHWESLSSQGRYSPQRSLTKKVWKSFILTICQSVLLYFCRNTYSDIVHIWPSNFTWHAGKLCTSGKKYNPSHLVKWFPAVFCTVIYSRSFKGWLHVNSHSAVSSKRWRNQHTHTHTRRCLQTKGEWLKCLSGRLELGRGR